MWSTFAIAAVCLAAFLIGLAVALYFKFKGRRSEREQRAKALSRFMTREAATGGSASGESGDGDFDGDD